MAGTGQLPSVLEALATRLDGASIKRSEVEAVLRAAHADSDLWDAVDEALSAAHVQVIDDVVPSPPPSGPKATKLAPTSGDPLAAARARLLTDRGRRSDRLPKIILTAEEEVGLTLLARPDGVPLDPGAFARLTGEAREAAEALLLHNMGLIHAVAQRMGGQGLEYEDLVANGVPGLVRAIELFDPHRGLKFSTYAMHWVRQSLSRAIANEGRIIRLPVHVVDAIRHVQAAQERLTVDGKMPRWTDVASECHMPVEKVEELVRLAPAVVSLDKPVGNDGVTLGDLVDQPVRECPVEVNGLDAEDLCALLDCLSDREADVLRRRHGLAPYDEGQTLEEIGVVYGVTRERIRQVETTALTNLRVAVGLEQPKARKKRGPKLAL